MTRRRALIASASTTVLIMLSACSGAEGEPDAGPTAGGSGDDLSLALVLGSRADGFHQSMACGARDEAKAQGVSIDIQGPGHYAAVEQTPILNSVVATSPDAIITDPTDRTAMQAPLEQAVGAGIELVLVDTTIDDPSIAVSAIATDNVTSGAMAAEHLAEALEGKSGSVAIISTQPGTSTVDDRQVGFEEEIANHDSLNYVGIEYAGEDAAKATQMFQSLQAAHPDLIGVFATTDTIAEGVGAGIRASQAADDIYAMAFDASPAEVDLLNDGLLDALLVQEAYSMGVIGVQQALASLRSEEVTAEIETAVVIATAENIDDPDVKKYLYEGNCA